MAWLLDDHCHLLLIYNRQRNRLSPHYAILDRPTLHLIHQMSNLKHVDYEVQMALKKIAADHF